MKEALTNSTYRRLYLAQIIALLGTGLATVALGLLAYDIAGSHAGQVLGTALTIKMVAYVIVAPLAAAGVARLPRKVVLVGSDALRLLVALSLPFVSDVWQVYVLVFILQASSATFTPTFQSVIPDVLPDEEEYTAALSLSRLAYDLEAVVSPMVAAVLLVIVDSSTLFFGTAIGFAGSALLVVTALIPRPVPAESAQMPFSRRARRGMSLFLTTPALRPVLALNLVVASAGAYVIVQTVVIVRSVFQLPEQGVAWVLGANGLGSMVAALALPGLLRRVPERRVMLAGAMVLPIVTAAIPWALETDNTAVGLAMIVVLWMLIGCAWSAAETPVGRIIRRNVGHEDLATAFAAQFSLSHACWLVTYPLVGWLGAVSLGMAAQVMAGIAGLATLLTILAWPRDRPSGNTLTNLPAPGLAPVDPVPPTAHPE